MPISRSRPSRSSKKPQPALVFVEAPRAPSDPVGVAKVVNEMERTQNLHRLRNAHANLQRALANIARDVELIEQGGMGTHFNASSTAANAIDAHAAIEALRTLGEQAKLIAAIEAHRGPVLDKSDDARNVTDAE